MRWLALLATICFASSAYAQSKGDDQPEFMRRPVEAERRHGFLFGVVTSATTTWAHGTPAEYPLRNERYAVDLGPAISPAAALFVGGAFSDRASFGFELSPSLVRTRDLRVTGASFAFRIELWPLRDVGVALRAGLGSANVRDAGSGDSRASTSGYSLTGLELLWEPLRLGPIAIGPTLGLAHRFSQTYRQTDLAIGVRTVFYAGP